MLGQQTKLVYYTFIVQPGKLQEKKMEPEKKKRNVNTSRNNNNLLLAYTYFLNSNHTTYISVGFDSETFQVNVILYKNTIAVTLEYQDWEKLYNNFHCIAAHFVAVAAATVEPSATHFIVPGTVADAAASILTEIPRKGGNCLFKLSCRNKEKCVLITKDDNKIMITHLEWENLNGIAQYINAVIIWSNNISPDIKAYYETYLKKCLDQNVIKLLPFDFYLPHPLTLYNSCNFVRLFNELAFISKNKLVNDFYEYTCKQLEKNKKI